MVTRLRRILVPLQSIVEEGVVGVDFARLLPAGPVVRVVEHEVQRTDGLLDHVERRVHLDPCPKLAAGVVPPPRLDGGHVGRGHRRSARRGGRRRGIRGPGAGRRGEDLCQGRRVRRRRVVAVVHIRRDVQTPRHRKVVVAKLALVQQHVLDGLELRLGEDELQPNSRAGEEEPDEPEEAALAVGRVGDVGHGWGKAGRAPGAQNAPRGPRRDSSDLPLSVTPPARQNAAEERIWAAPSPFRD